MPARSRACSIVSAKSLLLAAAAAAAVFAAGCANRCDYARTKCQYQCNRDYQVCQLHGNDEFYCRNQMGNCWTACDADRASCRSWL